MRRNGKSKVEALTAGKVHEMAVETLAEHLRLAGRGEQSAPEKVIDILLLAAANHTSIDLECAIHDQAPSANTIRGVVKASLNLEQAEGRINDALADRLDRRYWRKPVTAAVDLFEIPYHGTYETDPREVRGGEAKSGTTHFHVYASVYIVRRGRRLTLALHFVRQGESIVEVLEALWARLKKLGIKVGRWVADRGFYSVAALQWFSRFALAIIPVPGRGRKTTTTLGALRAQTEDGWGTHTVRSKVDSIPIDVAVYHEAGHVSRSGKWRPGATLLYAVVGYFMQKGGPRHAPAAIAAIYRERFGIESSHRQFHQCRLRTSSRSPVLRLLAVGIAVVLRNLWVLVNWMLAAHPGAGRRATAIKVRLRALARLIANEIDQRLHLHPRYPLPAPSPALL